eukprot:CAMPEP_0170498162 /NCGR_PEP_ID=MMETSP0208-20121228/27019_1 /TAXON_ID=197538 /ORGANISM="Strombidium inclinatum, Strain S3" /LENGTH=139 /DNA_ID=CAMNT_0010775253 /DNA_START=244 /DNA_END=659 /DNA_ORIENTATION=+
MGISRNALKLPLDVLDEGNEPEELLVLDVSHPHSLQLRLEHFRLLFDLLPINHHLLVDLQELTLEVAFLFFELLDTGEDLFYVQSLEGVNEGGLFMELLFELCYFLALRQDYIRIELPQHVVPTDAVAREALFIFELFV